MLPDLQFFYQLLYTYGQRQWWWLASQRSVCVIGISVRNFGLKVFMLGLPSKCSPRRLAGLRFGIQRSQSEAPYLKGELKNKICGENLILPKHVVIRLVRYNWYYDLQSQMFPFGCNVSMVICTDCPYLYTYQDGSALVARLLFAFGEIGIPLSTGKEECRNQV